MQRTLCSILLYCFIYIQNEHVEQVMEKLKCQVHCMEEKVHMHRS